MDVKGKTKDNPKARMNIKEYCRRKDLWLQELQNGKIVKPKASFSFTLDEKREIIEWVKNLRMPEGYASNLVKRVDMNEGKLIEHLPIHLVQEARLGGPVQTRWMYPFERRNRPNCNDEGDIDPLFPPISIFNQNGRGSKKRRKRGFTDMEMQSVVTHILVNCPEIQSYVNLFVNTWGNEAIYTEFSKWLRNYFQTEEISRNKKTNNSGVYIQCDVDGTGQTIEYYGVIQEIIEVRDKADWWVVIKSKLVGRIEIDKVLDVAYQNDVAIVQQQVDVELETTLQHPQHILEEVSDDEILNVEEEISENEENESFDDEEWDDNENETT
ncbi:hypothetical protein MTR67_031722 [Solanum verrucosum]|uniref:DUF4218 domain-containing protein n=1 Tax=Solanum verrucosum TaxID=315347 RepID=A0AAF0U332_SOLVR|nr:hypothetical protein MTR67_031722 [Solanum verrucosum]